MINKYIRLENQLLGTLYNDINDKSIIKIDIENVFYLLSQFEYVIPRRQFENKLEEILNKNLPEDYPNTHIGKVIIAQAIIKLADAMHVSKEMLKQAEKQANNINQGREDYSKASEIDIEDEHTV